MTVEFECQTHVPASVQETFDRSRSIDLHLSSMSDSREQAVAGVTPRLISEGEEVTWRAWHFGVPIRMTSRITAMTEPKHFVDEQVRGPFRSFRHEHEFRADESATLMIDRVKFTALLDRSAPSRNSFSAHICAGSSRSATRTLRQLTSRPRCVRATF